MEYLQQIIVEAFEKDYPAMMAAIKQAVKVGEDRDNFERFIKKQFPDHTTSILAQATMTSFDYYKKRFIKYGHC